jgi:hypothetical protein
VSIDNMSITGRHCPNAAAGSIPAPSAPNLRPRVTALLAVMKSVTAAATATAATTTSPTPAAGSDLELVAPLPVMVV